MFLLVLTALVAASGANKLETYLPPVSTNTAGGSPGSLQAPLTGSFRQDLSLPKGSFTNDNQGVIVDAALSGTRSGADSKQSGLKDPRPSYGSTASKVGDAAFRGSQNFANLKPETTQAAKESNSNILTYENNVDKKKYGQEIDDRMALVNEVAKDGAQTQGGYSYKGDDGQVYSVTYTADKNGYKLQGSHLPSDLYIPDEIQKSIEKNSDKEAASVVNNGSYDAQKYKMEGDSAKGDSYEYNGVQESQFDKRPGSKTTFIGAIINQNGLISGDKAKNIQRLGPDNRAARAIDFRALLRALAARITEAVLNEPSNPGAGLSVATLIYSMVNSNRPLGLGAILTLLNNALNSTDNNEQTVNNKKSTIKNTQIDALRNPVSSWFGTLDQPISTVEYIFVQSGNNEYSPPSSGQSAQPTFNGQSQNLATFGSNTNKPFGLGGFANQPGTGAAQSGSPSFGFQPAYENQQQILPSSFGPQPIPSKPISVFQGDQTGSNNFGEFPQQLQPEYNLNPMKDNVESQEIESENHQITNLPTQSPNSGSITPQTQFDSTQFSSQTSQNVPLSGSRPQIFNPTDETVPSKPIGASSQANPTPSQPQFDQTAPTSFPSSQPNRPQLGTQPFKPFGSFSQPGLVPNKTQFDQTSSSFPSSQPHQPQYGAQPFKPFGSVPQPGVFPVKPQFGQILPSSFPTPQSVQPQFGLNQASLPPQQSQYNLQSATNPQFGQPSVFTSNGPGTQTLRQQAKPFESQSSFPSFNQRTQESQASSSATAKGPSATASAQASTGPEPED